MMILRAGLSFWNLRVTIGRERSLRVGPHPLLGAFFYSIDCRDWAGRFQRDICLSSVITEDKFVVVSHWRYPESVQPFATSQYSFDDTTHAYEHVADTACAALQVLKGHLMLHPLLSRR